MGAIGRTRKPDRRGGGAVTDATDPADRRGWIPAPSEEYQRAHPDWNKSADDTLPGLADLLSIDAGRGKTMLGLSMGIGMATGAGLLHWRSHRPARGLVIDGEMPGELIRQRAIDALRRAGIESCPNLFIFGRDLEDEIKTRFPAIGEMPPLNTEAGHNWLLALIAALGHVDAVIFDNVMSLIAGDQKDEIPWSDTLPLVQSLTSKRIGQVWLDHTGHNTDRQYGSSTKAWRFDAVGVMTALPNDQKVKHEVAFTLSFEHPGKARRRTPDNWADFETVTIRLADDCWTSQPSGEGSGWTAARVAPSRIPFYDALLAAITTSPTAPGTTTVIAWQAACQRKGLTEAATGEETHQQRAARFRDFRKAKADLIAAKWIAVEENTVTDLRGRWT